MAWTTLSFPFGSILTSSKMTQMYDNFAALANGDSGAPSIQTAAIANDAITAAKIPAGAIGSSEIATDAVGASEIAAGAVGNSELATNAVTNVKITNGTIGTEKMQTGTTERDWVLARTAAATLGAVGTYALAGIKEQGGTPGVSSGSTEPGANMRYYSSGLTSGAFATSDIDLGTWRCMGWTIGEDEWTLFLRIS